MDGQTYEQQCETTIYHVPGYKNGLITFLCLPGLSCSKLTMSLVNDSLKFTSTDTQIY